LIDTDHPTMRDGKFPKRFCRSCFGKIPGKGSTEFDRLWRRFDKRQFDWSKHLDECRYAQNDKLCFTCDRIAARCDAYDFSDGEVIEVYTIEGVLWQAQVG
jgi:hypothetical protein